MGEEENQEWHSGSQVKVVYQGGECNNPLQTMVGKVR